MARCQVGLEPAQDLVLEVEVGRGLGTSWTAFWMEVKNPWVRRSRSRRTNSASCRSRADMGGSAAGAGRWATEEDMVKLRGVKTP